jgi:hypothetical protein
MLCHQFVRFLPIGNHSQRIAESRAVVEVNRWGPTSLGVESLIKERSRNAWRELAVLIQCRRRRVLALKLEDHPADMAVASMRLQEAQALVRIAPL